MEMPEHNEEFKFQQLLRGFWSLRGITQMRIPMIGGQ
jgi:hypothetical protein